MKKILLYTRPIIPPWDEASKNLAYEIARTHNGDFEMHILTVKRSGFKVTNSNHRPIVSESLYSSARLGTIEKLQLLRRLYRFDLDADIIHFLFTPRALTSTLIQARLNRSRCKSVQTVATIPDDLYGNPTELRSMLFANKVVAQSYFTQGKLTKAGIRNVSLIYPGIDLKKYQAASKDPALMNQWNISQEDIVILYPGEYTRLKAIDDIVRAFDIITRQRHFPYKLILACRLKSEADTIKKAEVMEKIRHLGYDNRVVFIDTFADMPKLYNLSDMVIFPVQEMKGKFDIPLAVIEPMACRKPVIISDIEILQEFIKDNITGLVTPRANPAVLAETILRLGTNAGLRETLADNGDKFVKLTFDIQQCVKKYEELYQSL